MLNASVTPTPQTPPPLPWWQLPANFVPSEPFHPRLTIVPFNRLLARAQKLAAAGEQQRGIDLVKAAARALAYPHEPKFIEATVTLNGECQCAACQAKRAHPGSEAA